MPHANPVLDDHLLAQGAPRTRHQPTMLGVVDVHSPASTVLAAAGACSSAPPAQVAVGAPQFAEPPVLAVAGPRRTAPPILAFTAPRSEPSNAPATIQLTTPSPIIDSGGQAAALPPRQSRSRPPPHRTVSQPHQLASSLTDGSPVIIHLDGDSPPTVASTIQGSGLNETPEEPTRRQAPAARRTTRSAAGTAGPPNNADSGPSHPAAVEGVVGIGQPVVVKPKPTRAKARTGKAKRV